MTVNLLRFWAKQINSNQNDSITLKAMYWSVLFVRCSEHEICFFNSTAWSNKQRKQKRGELAKWANKYDHNNTQKKEVLKREPQSQEKQERRNIKISPTKKTFMSRTWKQKYFTRKPIETAEITSTVKLKQFRTRNKEIKKERRENVQAKRSSLGSIPSSSLDSELIFRRISAGNQSARV